MNTFYAAASILSWPLGIHIGFLNNHMQSVDFRILSRSKAPTPSGSSQGTLSLFKHVIKTLHDTGKRRDRNTVLSDPDIRSSACHPFCFLRSLLKSAFRPYPVCFCLSASSSHQLSSLLAQAFSPSHWSAADGSRCTTSLVEIATPF